jgi:hypothetical protein
MTVRSLDLLDLPTIHRYRKGALSLDSERALTRGNPLGAVGLLAYLDPTQHVYTAVCKDDGSTALLGGVTFKDEQPFARLSFLSPKEELGSSRVLELLDHLAEQVGSWGALYLLAEVDENSDVYRPLRQAGFSVYAWQRIWDLTDRAALVMGDSEWRPARSYDLIPIQNLYHQIIPGMLQAIQACPRKAGGLVSWADDELEAHADLDYGPNGILVNPLIHPDTDEVAVKLAGLLNAIPDRRGRPVYLCMRSYQTWLESVLEDLGAAAGPRQAVMIKRLVALKHAEQTVPANSETAWAKPATPIVRTHRSNSKMDG